MVIPSSTCRIHAASQGADEFFDKQRDGEVVCGGMNKSTRGRVADLRAAGRVVFVDSEEYRFVYFNGG